MPTFRSSDAQLAYDVAGAGPDVVLLHPFPLHHHFWDGVLDQIATLYRVFLPDLRAHGDSEAGDGPVTMQKLADDLDQLCRELDIARAIFVGVSIGGYALFEFWRRYRERVAALVFANTRAGAETADGRAGRLQAAERVLREGAAGFTEELLHRLFSPTTIANRADIVNAVLFGSLDKGTTVDLTPFTQAANNLDSLMSLVNSNLLHGSMSDQLNTAARSAVSTATTAEARAQGVLYIVLTSGEYQIIH